MNTLKVEKQIKDNMYTRKWCLVGFLIALSSMVVLRRDSFGIFAILLLQMVTSLNSSIKQDRMLIIMNGDA